MVDYVEIVRADVLQRDGERIESHGARSATTQHRERRSRAHETLK